MKASFSVTSLSFSLCVYNLLLNPSWTLCRLWLCVGVEQLGAFVDSLPTRPIPSPEAGTQMSLPMQSLLNYRPQQKQDLGLHNGVFLHDSPITDM